MFYGNTNMDANGVRYTVYSGHSLNSYVYDDLFYNGVNVSEEQAMIDLKHEITADADNIEDECRIALEEAGGLTADEFEHLLEQNIEAAYERLGYQDREDYIDGRVERESEFLQIDEPTIEGEADGVNYGITWLGGAPLVWVFKAPTTSKFRLCSPCVPNACDGNNPDEDGYEGYAAPADWFDAEE